MARKKSFAGRLGLGLLTLALGAVGCDSTNTVAGDVLRRTIPTGDTAPTLSGPVWTGQSARFTWEFETGLGTGYADWLLQHLHEFRVVERDPSHLWLTKNVPGDAYTLRIALEPIDQRIYVRVTLTTLPD